MHPKKYNDMKRIFIISSFMMLLSASTFAQRKAYIDVWMQPWPLSSKYLLCADFGRNDVESITEENNPATAKQFSSPMSGINFLSSLGCHLHIPRYRHHHQETSSPLSSGKRHHQRIRHNEGHQHQNRKEERTEKI